MHDHVCTNRFRRQQAQRRERIGGIGPATPFLPVVQTVAVRVSAICCAVGGQAVLLQPSVREGRGGRLKLIRTNVHGATHDARIPIQVGASGCEPIETGIDTGRRLQMEVAFGLVHEQWRIGKVADPTDGSRQGAAVIHNGAIRLVVVIRALVSRVEIEDAVVQSAPRVPAAEGSGVARQSAVIQSAAPWRQPPPAAKLPVKMQLFIVLPKAPPPCE